MNLQPYDLLLYKGNNIISRIIKKQTGSNYSHVAVVLDNKHIVEIDNNINLSINHLRYRNTEVDVYRLKEPLTKEQEIQLSYYISSTLNAKYNFIEIIDFLLYKFFKFTIKSDPNKFICSGWTNELFKSAGIVLSDKNLVSPQDLICDKLYLLEDIDYRFIGFSYRDK